MALSTDNLAICVHVGSVDDDHTVSHCLEFTASISIINPIFPKDLIVFWDDFITLNVSLPRMKSSLCLSITVAISAVLVFKPRQLIDMHFNFHLLLFCPQFFNSFESFSVFNASPETFLLSCVDAKNV